MALAVVESLEAGFSSVQQWLFEHAIEPLAVWLGFSNLLTDAYDATGWLVVGLVQIAVMLLLIAPMERFFPAEPLSDRRAVRVDVVYTLIHRLGLFKLLMFFTVQDWLREGFGVLRAQGFPTFHLDQIWPGLTDQPLLSFCIYLVLFDFLQYWIHRAQHSLEPWWALHALHHSQRQMTMWTDNRNHLLDDMVGDAIFVVVAMLVGVPPGQFVAVVAVSQLSENLQHANVRLCWWPWLERLWVSPAFHRLHHAVGIGHESDAEPASGLAPRGGALGGHNFGVLLPWWDMLFGTARFGDPLQPTGVRDQVEQGRDYGKGFWAQQRLGLLRLIGRA